MQKSILSLLIVVAVSVALSAATPYHGLDESLNKHWDDFTSVYNKKYDAQFQYVRRMIWESNLNYIQKHNIEYDMGKHSYSLGMNEFGDYTHQEFKSFYLGVKTQFNNLNRTGTTFLSSISPNTLPKEVDWRTKGYVTPVKNQGQCGSCWSFSTTGSLEGQYFRKNGKLVSFSEQQLVDCSGNYGNNGCSGGLMDNAFKYLEQQGLEAESDYPYTARDGRCHIDQSKTVTEVTGFVDIPNGDEDKMKEAVANNGPVSVAIDASHPSFQFYRRGVYDERKCSPTQLDHGVLAVGYGAEDGNDYWLVKNSWGPTWGIGGYIQMSRNRDNQCGIATSASYPLM
jgi:cathepsin L